MTCPSCGTDYSESKSSKNNNRITIGPLPHYGQPYQISGMICRSCGFVAEVIKKPTGNPFFKRQEPNEVMNYTNSEYYEFIINSNLFEEFKLFISNKKCHTENPAPKLTG